MLAALFPACGGRSLDDRRDAAAADATIEIQCPGSSGLGPPTWVRSYQRGYAYDVAVLSTGQIALGGSTSGVQDYGGGPLTAGLKAAPLFVLLDADGRHLASRLLDTYGYTYPGDTRAAIAPALAGHAWLGVGGVGPQDFGTGVVPAGPDSSGLFLLDVDPTGAMRVVRHFSGAPVSELSGPSIIDLASDGAGGVSMSGFAPGLDLGTGAGPGNVIARMSPDGTLSMSRVGLTGYATLATKDGGLVAVVPFSKTVDLGLGPLTSRGGMDFAVVRLDATGATRWARAIGGRDDELATGLAVDARDHVWVGAMQLSTEIDLGDGLRSVGTEPDGGGLFELSPTGQVLGVTRPPGLEPPPNERAYVNFSTVHLLGGGDVLVGGYFHTSIRLGRYVLRKGVNDFQIFLARRTPEGNFKWARCIRAGEINLLGDAQETADGQLIVAGGGDAAVDFGDGPMAETGPGMFVTKLPQ